MFTFPFLMASSMISLCLLISGRINFSYGTVRIIDDFRNRIEGLITFFCLVKRLSAVLKESAVC